MSSNETKTVISFILCATFLIAYTAFLNCGTPEAQCLSSFMERDASLRIECLKAINNKKSTIKKFPRPVVVD